MILTSALNSMSYKCSEMYEAQDTESQLTQPIFILGIGEHHLRNESRKSGTYYRGRTSHGNISI